MASSFNRVILAGNMTRDPEARALPSGQALTKFSLAVNRAYTISMLPTNMSCL